jgi:hypothetical protein
MTTLTLLLAGRNETDIEELNQQIQLDLRDVEEIQFQLVSKTGIPKGTKSGTDIDWTTIVVTILASGGVLTTLINLVQSKLTKERSVTLEMNGDKLTITGVSTEDQKRLIDDWLKRRRSETSPKPHKAND